MAEEKKKKKGGRPRMSAYRNFRFALEAEKDSAIIGYIDRKIEKYREVFGHRVVESTILYPIVKEAIEKIMREEEAGAGEEVAYWQCKSKTK